MFERNRKKNVLSEFRLYFILIFQPSKKERKKNFIQIEKTKRIAYKIDIHHMTFCQQRNNSMLEF